MERNKVKYSVGDLFIIRLENGQRILGLITHRKQKTKLLAGYFWKFSSEFEVNNSELKKTKVILITKFSGLGFEVGNWSLIGKMDEWCEDNWKLPRLRKHNCLINKYYAITYDKNLEEISEYEISQHEASTLYEDGNHGYISLENVLSRCT